MVEMVELIPVDESTVGGNIRRVPRYADARQVCARTMSVGEREFYDSVQAGYRLDIRLKLWQWDYQDERRVRFGGREYEIVRSYRDEKAHAVELSCQRVEGRQPGT